MSRDPRGTEFIAVPLRQLLVYLGLAFAVGVVAGMALVFTWWLA